MPLSRKLFRVPPPQQTATKVETKIEAPELKSPAKAEDRLKSELESAGSPKTDS
jgi:hypothetical protein